jgi:hypothetical protein
MSADRLHTASISRRPIEGLEVFFRDPGVPFHGDLSRAMQ